MATSLSVTRVVAGDPAVAALLIADPSAAGFLPQVTLTAAAPGRIDGILHIAQGDERELQVLTNPTRRTPTAYIAEFHVEVDGMPATEGSLQVTSAGPARSQVRFSLTSQEEIPAEFDGVFNYVVNGFFDNLQRAAREQHDAA